MDPEDADFAFIKIVGADWINIEGIKFHNFWPSAVFMRGVHHINMNRCELIGGQWCFYVRSAGNKHYRTKLSRFIRMHEIRWIQDPAHEMWTGRVSWDDIKQEKKTVLDASYFNGGLFGSYDIQGPVIMTSCDISHAFNVIRMDAASKKLKDKRNCGVLISGNTFRYIRDNAIEPEVVVQNLFVLNNTFFNVHSPFSLDGVSGQYWYYINNRVLNLEKPSRPPDENTGGKIYKLDQTGDYPKRAFYSLHNSIQTRTAYAKKGMTRNWIHMNNAIGICRKGVDCFSDRQMFTPKLEWHKSFKFKNDICDHPNYPERMRADGYMVYGKNSGPKTFRKPGIKYGHWNGKLELSPNGPGEKASIGTSLELDQSFHNVRKWMISGDNDIGAVSESELGFPDFLTPEEFGMGSDD